jgi:hypothetical protein
MGGGEGGGKLESTSSVGFFGRLGQDRRTTAAAAAEGGAPGGRQRAADMAYNLRHSQKATHQLEKLILK